MVIDRRQLLAGTLAAGAVRVLPAPVQPGGGPFQHGVASGDPLPDAVIIWTRVTPAVGADRTAVRWIVAGDEALTGTVRQGDVETTGAADHTVKVDVTGLDPATTYHYGFEVAGARSPVGRTKTAPATGTAIERLRIGVTSCGRYAAGFFNGYGRLAARDLDLVIHLGDYIYEDGSDAVREHEPGATLRTLDDYRRRYAQHRTDPDLQELHRRHPMANVWDDHELAGNAWRGGARDHDDASDGPWTQRRDAAARAWREWLPFRPPDPDDPLRIWRRLGYGRLADVILLDTRLHGRDRQVDPGGTVEQLRAPDRRLLGEAQETWLHRQLAESTAVWKIVGNQVMLSPLRFPVPIDAVADSFRTRGFVAGGDDARNPDQWDGYAAERQRLVDAVEREQTGNVVVLTGDIHSSFVNEVAGAIVELVTPSVTSANFDELLGSAAASSLLETALRGANPHVRYAELRSHGYVVLDLTAERLQADWWFVDRLDRRDPGEHHGTSWVVDARATAAPTETSEPTADPEPATAPGGGGADDGDDRTPLLVGGTAAAVAAAGGALIALRRRRSSSDAQ